MATSAKTSPETAPARASRVRRIPHLVAWVAAVGLALAVSGCAAPVGGIGSPPTGSAIAAATITLIPTATPRPIAVFTCAAGSLPVRPASTRTSCSISTQHGAQVLSATYANGAGSQPSVDENALTAAGWKIAAAAHGDGAVTSQGYGVYFYQSSWFAFEWTGNSSGSFKLTIQASVSPDNAAVACGQTPTASSANLNGIVLPSGSFLLLDGTIALAPACAADAQHFYEATLSAAGWHEDQPFASISYGPGSDQVKDAIFTRGNTQAIITTAGYPGTRTLIIVGTSS